MTFEFNSAEELAEKTGLVPSFEIDISHWNKNIAIVHDVRKYRDRPLKVDAILLMKDINLKDSPFKKEDYLGEWIVEALSRNGKTAIVKRPPPTSKKRKS